MNFKKLRMSAIEPIRFVTPLFNFLEDEFVWSSPMSNVQCFPLLVITSMVITSMPGQLKPPGKQQAPQNCEGFSSQLSELEAPIQEGFTGKRNFETKACQVLICSVSWMRYLAAMSRHNSNCGQASPRAGCWNSWDSWILRQRAAMLDWFVWDKRKNIFAAASKKKKCLEKRTSFQTS